MLYIILTVLLACTTIGWIKYRISAMALAYYMVKKGYPAPDKRDIEECAETVMKMIIHGGGPHDHNNA